MSYFDHISEISKHSPGPFHYKPLKKKHTAAASQQGKGVSFIDHHLYETLENATKGNYTPKFNVVQRRTRKALFKGPERTSPFARGRSEE